MKHTWKAVVAAAVLIGSTQIVRADLTLDGQTGLINNPTAEVAQKSTGEVQLMYQHIAAPEDYPSVNSYNISGAFGAVDKGEINGELARSVSDGYNQKMVAVGGKYQLLRQEEKGVDVAVGGRYAHINNDEDDPSAKIYSLYLVGTRAFGGGKRAPIKATLGVRWDKVEFGYGAESKTSVYGGVQVPITSTGGVSLIGEVQSKNYDDPYATTPYALGVRWAPTNKKYSVTAGINRDGILVADGHAYFIQAGYKFGK